MENTRQLTIHLAHWFIKDLHTLYQMLSQGSFCFHLYFFTMELRKKPPTCYFTVCGSLITYIVELSTPGSCDTVVQRPLWVYPWGHCFLTFCTVSLMLIGSVLQTMVCITTKTHVLSWVSCFLSQDILLTAMQTCYFVD